ncbi:hypothetical protein Tco_0379282 [Tanacetum coccineum]
MTIAKHDDKLAWGRSRRADGWPNSGGGCWQVLEAEEQVVAPVVDMNEDITMLFGDDDFEDDDSEGFDEEEVWEVNEEWQMAPATPLLLLLMGRLLPS